MLSPKKLQYQQINKIITISVVFIYIFYREIINIFISFFWGVAQSACKVAMRKMGAGALSQRAQGGEWGEAPRAGGTMCGLEASRPMGMTLPNT
ncbi:hypothetical protein O0880_04445 [Janthinobacterium sp. SUN118]|uniref:hypothetical protein n=1 Tax=Janthinobacterium sp. SUN118 TaxID=3004100 RepID=UPI0025AFD295|nr:hypothetical protein [Janthinobacterium sp. SUN118]MDN2708666.1 hypothetical protein [Janthinobacterium sp. SUN118]